MTNDTMKALEWFNRRIEYFAVKHPQEIKHVDTIRAALSPVDVAYVRGELVLENKFTPPSGPMSTRIERGIINKPESAVDVESLKIKRPEGLSITDMDFDNHEYRKGWNDCLDELVKRGVLR